MRFAAAKCRLQLDDRIAAQSGEAARDRHQQQAHSFGNKRARKKLCRILIGTGCLAIDDLGNIGGKFRLLKRTFQHIFVWFGDGAPGGEGHKNSLKQILNTLNQYI